LRRRRGPAICDEHRHQRTFGIHILAWKVSFEADPTTEVDLDLKRADAFIGVANSAVMDVLDTTAGVSSESTAAQGYMLQGAKVVLSASTKPEDLLRLIEQHRATHLKVVPALLIRLINDPAIGGYDLSSLRVIQSGGQRMQPEVRARTKQLIPASPCRRTSACPRACCSSFGSTIPRTCAWRPAGGRSRPTTR